MFNDSSHQTVCYVLAEYVGRPAHNFRMSQRLDRDLGIGLLEREMVALRIEELDSIEIPRPEFEALQTVGQLVLLLRALKRASELEERPHYNHAAERPKHFVTRPH